MDFFWYLHDDDATYKVVWLEQGDDGIYKVGQFIVFYVSDWGADVREFVAHQSLISFLAEYPDINRIEYLPDFLETHKASIIPGEYAGLVKKFI